MGDVFKEIYLFFPTFCLDIYFDNSKIKFNVQTDSDYGAYNPREDWCTWFSNRSKARIHICVRCQQTIMQ